MKRLKGMTWDHDRGIKPLVAAGEIFKKRYGIEITWDARSLGDFELFPLEQLADKYDLIMIDHPHIGAAHAQKLLCPLENLLSKELLDKQKEGSVGQSYNSYYWEGHQYAMPLDAAAQVSAYREDLFEQIGESVPETWDEVFELADNLPDQLSIAIPFVPVHAYSSFFTLCSHFSTRLFWSNGEDLDIEAGEKALDYLIRLLKVAHKESKNMNPINMLDKMATDNEIIYSPLVYGYSNYARTGYGKYIVKFRDMPRDGNIPKGSMIGGVGLAISSKCNLVDEAVCFVQMVSNPLFQKTTFFEAGGQPGHIEAWLDVNVNEKSHNFFKGTLDTLKYGSVRPRFPGYIDFQAEAGARIRSFVLDGNGNKKVFIKELNELIKICRIKQGLE